MLINGSRYYAQSDTSEVPIGVEVKGCRLNRHRRCDGEITSDGKADRFCWGFGKRVSNLHRGRDVCGMLRLRYQKKPERAKTRRKQQCRSLLRRKEDQFMANKEKTAVWLYPETKEQVTYGREKGTLRPLQKGYRAHRYPGRNRYYQSGRRQICSAGVDLHDLF